MQRLHLISLASLASFVLGFSIPEETRRLLLTRITSLISLGLELGIPQHIFRAILTILVGLGYFAFIIVQIVFLEIFPPIFSFAFRIFSFVFFGICYVGVRNLRHMVDVGIALHEARSRSWASRGRGPWNSSPGGEYGNGDEKSTEELLAELRQSVSCSTLISVPPIGRFLRALFHGISVLFFLLMLFPHDKYFNAIAIGAMVAHFDLGSKLDLNTISEVPFGGGFWGGATL